MTLGGVVHRSQERGTLGATDPPDGRLTSLARVDLDRYDQQVEGDLLPVWVQLTTVESGAPDPPPQRLDPPAATTRAPP